MHPIAVLARRTIPRRACLALLALAAANAVGCGGKGVGSADSTSNGSTTVTILATSDANGQLSEFDVVLTSLKLIGNSGKTIDLITTPIHAEFMHVNGTSEPLFTVSVPQGTYTSATASVGTSGFTCVSLNPSTSNGLQISYFGNELASTPDVTVNLPMPITITGTSMSLSLDLLVSQSATWTTCNPNGIEPFAVTPTFKLIPLTASSATMNGQNGIESGLKGLIASVDGPAKGFTVTAADGAGCAAAQGQSGCVSTVDGPLWKVVSNGSTSYQGITGFSQLAAGMPVDMDAALQPDGSLQATRVAVYDMNDVDLTTANGPLLFVSGAWPALDSYPREELGPLKIGSYIPFNFSSAVFQTSSHFRNLSNLPFTASFNASNMIAGQNTYISTHALSLSIGPTFVPATTITLMPQTVNGTVKIIASEGGFTTYGVTLAPYDLFPQLSVQAGQTTLLTNPDTVVVYTDSNTQMLNSRPIAVGDVVRFYGLVFNDNGTLRMDCAQINDGVAE